MTWLDIITPIPKTLIPDDQLRAEYLQIRFIIIKFVTMIIVGHINSHHSFPVRGGISY